ncbi:MAG: RNA-binding S4 domain-containing protein [Clostridia bacterium]|nr:RNA-binding S4 domain-containing protein [Clostridia bacterium]
MAEKIKINGEFIRLDDLLKVTGSVVTGGHAKIVIQEGEVKLNGEVCTMRGKKIRSGDTVEFQGEEFVVE